VVLLAVVGLGSAEENDEEEEEEEERADEAAAMCVPEVLVAPCSLGATVIAVGNAAPPQGLALLE